MNNQNGKVFLVGAGPGDPDLLTLKAARLLSQCDVVIFDYLVNPVVLRHAPVQALRIFVGKPRQRNRLSQAAVEQIMIAQALQGRNVVRLKGGDPFIFGRGGEEAEALLQAGIEWEVVPGISAGHAVPAYAGIPLTHRALASSVAFVTGHESGEKSFAVDWNKLAHAVETIVVFMGVKKLPDIVAALIRAGRAATTPVAVIESGTQDTQRIVSGTLATIACKSAAAKVKSPALTVVGDVVNLHEKLKWFPAPGNIEDAWREQAGAQDEVFAAVS